MERSGARRAATATIGKTALRGEPQRAAMLAA